MDEYIDSFFSSSSWVDEEVKQESTWGYSELNQPNMLLPSSLYENDTGSFPFSSKLPTQDVAFENFGDQAQLDKKGDIMVNGSLKDGNVSLQYDTAFQVFDPLNLSYPKQIPGLDDLALPLCFNEECDVGGFCEQFNYNRSFADLQNLSSMQQTWPSTAMGQETKGEFGIQEGNLGDELNSILKRKVDMGQIALEKLSASITTEDKEDIISYPVSSLADVPNRTTTNGVPFQSQTSSAGGTGVCNGTGKARVRARRGQATDPHSIAERLRREKIAERMKNLQELVPNSTKVDKASMLDEIIEYVKFLQLQVKVLSMSRVGAAEAVVPLITDGQTEACNNLSLTPSTGLGDNISASPEQIAFEQHVLKLMESNMTMAIQHLQSKGLCLMPIALATALPNEKGFTDKTKVGFTDDGLKSNSSSSSSCSFSSNDPCRKSYDGNNVAQQLSPKVTTVNGCNGTIKPETWKKDFPGN